MSLPTSQGVKDYIVTNVFTPLITTLSADVSYKDGESLNDMKQTEDNILIMNKDESRHEEFRGPGVIEHIVTYIFVNIVQKEVKDVNIATTTNEARQNTFEEAVFDQVMASTASTLTDRPYTKRPEMVDSGFGYEEDPVDLPGSDDFNFEGKLVFFVTYEFTYWKTQ